MSEHFYLDYFCTLLGYEHSHLNISRCFILFKCNSCFILLTCSWYCAVRGGGGGGAVLCLPVRHLSSDYTFLVLWDQWIYLEKFQNRILLKPPLGDTFFCMDSASLQFEVLEFPMNSGNKRQLKNKTEALRLILFSTISTVI